MDAQNIDLRTSRELPCGTCEKWKPREDFPLLSSRYASRGRRRKDCKECRNAYLAKLRREDRAKKRQGFRLAPGVIPDVCGMDPRRLALALRPGNEENKKRRSYMTEDQVIELRERYAAGELTADLAIDFDTTATHVARVARGAAYKFFGGPVTVRGRNGRVTEKELAK